MTQLSPEPTPERPIKCEPSDNPQLPPIPNSADLSVNCDITKLKGDMLPGLNKIPCKLSTANYGGIIPKYEKFDPISETPNQVTNFVEARQRGLVPAGQKQTYQPTTYKPILPAPPFQFAPIPNGMKRSSTLTAKIVPKSECDNCRKRQKCSVHATKFIGKRIAPGVACASCRKRKRRCQGSHVHLFEQDRDWRAAQPSNTQLFPAEHLGRNFSKTCLISMSDKARFEKSDKACF